MTDLESVHTKQRDDAETASGAKRPDKRIEEWLTSLKDGAEERSPEVLGSLAGKARDVANYLDKLAEQARARRAADEAESAAGPESPTVSLRE